MKAVNIPAHEAGFRQTGIDSAGKKFTLADETVQISGTNETITLVDCPRANGDASFYYTQTPAKKKIVLHFTMGFLKGDVATLTKPDQHLSVPFVVARDGNIYNLFASKYWSYHLGPGTAGGNTPMSKESIGIEISNIGPLIKAGSNLNDTYGGLYCALSETEHYIKLNNPYRGYEYYAAYPEAQYVSIIKLLRFLCAKYGIPRTFVPAAQRFQKLSSPDFTSFVGIASHVNCRSDKVDIGPAFDWDRVVTGVSQ